MKKDEFYSFLEIEKVAESMRQNPLTEILQEPPEQPMNKALPWMRNMLEGSDRQEEIERLCDLEDICEEDIQWNEFTDGELWYMLKARPDFASECPAHILRDLPQNIWFSLLLDFPLLFAIRCPYIQQFSDDDWRLIVGKYPQLSHRRPHPDRW